MNRDTDKFRMQCPLKVNLIYVTFTLHESLYKVLENNTYEKHSLCDDGSHFKMYKSATLLKTQVYSKE